MKKIFTLFFAVGTVCIASAQSRTPHDNKFDSKPAVVLSSFGHETSYFSAKEKDAMIRKINFDFDRKIRDVQLNRWMRNREKARQIQMLNKQRFEEIRQVQIRFEQANRKRDNRHFDDHRGY